LSNSVDANTVAAAGISLSNTLSADTEVVLATFETTGSSTVTITDASLGTDTLPMSVLSITEAGYSDETGFIIDASPDSSVQIVPYADYTPQSGVITPTDALGVLKTVVGMNLNPTINELIAGDVNMDGKLTPTDALSILKYVVGMNGGVDPEWIFSDVNADYSASTSQNIGYSNVIDLGLVASGVDLQLEGYLLGDFNGTL